MYTDITDQDIALVVNITKMPWDRWGDDCIEANAWGRTYMMRAIAGDGYQVRFDTGDRAAYDTVKAAAEYIAFITRTDKRRWGDQQKTDADTLHKDVPGFITVTDEDGDKIKINAGAVICYYAVTDAQARAREARGRSTIKAHIGCPGYSWAVKETPEEIDQLIKEAGQ